MIYSGTYSTVLASQSGFVSGLVGTLGVRVIDATGATIVSRRTSGITEPIATSGFYVASIDLTALSSAPAAGHYFVFWDDGSVTPGHTAQEDLMLHQTTTLSVALRTAAASMSSHNGENVLVGLFVG